VCVSRAGASSLAELAAMRLPSLLVPLPTAADNHQFCNAAAFEKTGAARILEQRKATPETTAAGLAALVEDHSVRDQMQSALAQWHAPQSAALIAGHILSALEQGAASVVEVPHRGNPSNPAKLKATV
jgi:UDP-N-acetylglucosamine--N-acetylmuramyl-(pentapeptide) pyrophosphoryl-undecaprenol N-acetylglucosamine transferase